MRTAARSAAILLLVLVLSLAASLAGCAASTGTGELTSDESPVPAGQPVMYEFYTTS